MRFWAHDAHDFPLPQGHRFPLGKYRLLRERLLTEGVAGVAVVPSRGNASGRHLP